MLTAERVMGRKWRYSVIKNNDRTDHKATFEVLEVGRDGKLGIFVSSKSTTRSGGEVDLSSLDDLTLEKLDELVQKGFAWELFDTPKTERDKDGEFITTGVMFAATGLGAFGFWILVAALQPTQKPWEAAIGVALMIGAMIGAAIHRT